METDPFTRRSLIQFQIKIIVITLSSELKMGFYCPFEVLYSKWVIIPRFQAARFGLLAGCGPGLQPEPKLCLSFSPLLLLDIIEGVG